jgi:hypothetical protein
VKAVLDCDFVWCLPIQNGIGWYMMVKVSTRVPPVYYLYTHIKRTNLHNHFVEGEVLGQIWSDNVPSGMFWLRYPDDWADHLHFDFAEPVPGIPGAWIDRGNALLHMDHVAAYEDPGGNYPFVWDIADLGAQRVGFRVQPDGGWPGDTSVKWMYPPGAVGKHAPVVKGDLDIIAKAEDNMLGRLYDGMTPAYTGVYKLGFWIKGPTDQSYLGSEESPLVLWTFSDSLPDSLLFYNFYSHYGDTWHNFYYIATNLGGASDSCWSTRARFDRSGLSAVKDTGDTAITPDFAKFPDDTYYVYVRAWDAALHQSPAIPAKVVLENYYPIVTSVYPADGTCVPPVAADTIRVYFSESILPLQVAFTRVKLYDEMRYTTHYAPCAYYDPHGRWAVYVDTACIESGLYQATLVGALRDLSGKWLDGNKDGTPDSTFVWHFSVATGEIYVAEACDGVRVYQDNGDLLWGFQSPDSDSIGSTWWGSAITLTEDPSGRISLYLAASTIHEGSRIRKYSVDGTIIARSGVFDHDLLHLASDNLNIYATEDIPDTPNPVLVFDLDLNLVRTWHPECVEPKGIACSQQTHRIYMDGYYMVIDSAKVPPETTYEYVLASYDAWGLTLTDTIGLESYSASQCPWDPNPVAVDGQCAYVGVCIGSSYRILVFDLGLNSYCWSLPVDGSPNNGFAIFGENMWIAGGVPGSAFDRCLNVITKHDSLWVDTICDMLPGVMQVATYPPDGGSGFFASLRPEATPALPHIQTAEAKKHVPQTFALSQNSPNPFYGDTRISYAIPKRSHVVLRIYDVAGRLVSTLVDEEEDPGFYDVQWRSGDALGQQMPNGVYLCRLHAGRFTATRKLVLVR